MALHDYMSWYLANVVSSEVANGLFIVKSKGTFTRNDLSGIRFEFWRMQSSK